MSISKKRKEELIAALGWSGEKPKVLQHAKADLKAMMVDPSQTYEGEPLPTKATPKITKSKMKDDKKKTPLSYAEQTEDIQREWWPSQLHNDEETEFLRKHQGNGWWESLKAYKAEELEILEEADAHSIDAVSKNSLMEQAATRREYAEASLQKLLEFWPHKKAEGQAILGRKSLIESLSEFERELHSHKRWGLAFSYNLLNAHFRIAGNTNHAKMAREALSIDEKLAKILHAMRHERGKKRGWARFREFYNKYKDSTEAQAIIAKYSSV